MIRPRATLLVEVSEMEKTLALEPTAEEAAELQAALARSIAEMDELRRRMRSDQAEIEKSAARTRAMLVDLSAALETV